MTLFKGNVKGHKLLQAIVLATVLFGVACQSSGPYAPLKDAGGSQPLEHRQRIVVFDRNIRDSLVFVNSVQKRLPGGQILVQANFQNRRSDQNLWADVRFEFLDASNMVVDETEWMHVYFPRLEVTMVQGNSLSPDAVKHVMLLKNLKSGAGVLPATSSILFEIRGDTTPDTPHQKKTGSGK